MKSPNKIGGPIPGENFTSDTRNYPWHRPPDVSDYVVVVNRAVENLMSNPEKTAVALTALETGESILDFVVGTLRVTVGNGKVPIDVAVLAAGPIAKALEVLAEKAGIDFDRGWEQEPRLLTAQRVRAMSGGSDKPKAAAPKTDVVEEKNTGMMARGSGPAPKDVQSDMLGYSDEEEEMQ
jgi:hypothetical protein